MSGFTAVSSDACGDVTIGRCQETLPAAAAAEIVRAAPVLGAMTRRFDDDGHAADRIALFAHWYRRPGVGRRLRGGVVTDLDYLRQDAERHFLRCARADVDPCGIRDRVKRMWRCAPFGERPANLRKALPAGDDAEVCGLDRQRSQRRFLIVVPERGNDREQPS